MRAKCAHPQGWTQTGAGAGAWRCERCGTRRFTHYASLRPPGLPAAVTPSPAARRAADRAAARNVAGAWARPRRPRWASYAGKNAWHACFTAATAG
ncbi:DUF6255 family natural product biosynthesis protein [Streptomyces griseocarneus]|uniref:DUF6255 family natural product biosynthesis protein n=1 Tax=Streptomyces griseocarneus TaxID=51201 RepID=UPI001CCBD271|nr:hypothetical protein [Streptomyces griseocarneus]